MRTSDFDYELPAELIAQEPVEPRDSARLMVVKRDTEEILHRQVAQLPSLLRAGDLLVVNDTRVMAARLLGRRRGSGGQVEALLVRQVGERLWATLFRPARRARSGQEFVFTASDGPLPAVARGRRDELVILEFERAFDPATVGLVPLPPYIRGYRGDPERYQTLFARDPASAAAPTAGLHFTPHLLEELSAAGIEQVAVTLEIGPGTFRPVTVDDPLEHRMHGERFHISEDAAARINAARERERRIVAVGTTVVRTLEHVYLEEGRIRAGEGETALFILPGHDFRAVDVLLTNFHLPRSTLLMLVAAFAGRELVLAAYREAIARRYRFYSFGDAMLIL